MAKRATKMEALAGRLMNKLLVEADRNSDSKAWERCLKVYVGFRTMLLKSQTQKKAGGYDGSAWDRLRGGTQLPADLKKIYDDLLKP